MGLGRCLAKAQQITSRFLVGYQLDLRLCKKPRTAITLMGWLAEPSIYTTTPANMSRTQSGQAITMICPETRCEKRSQILLAHFWGLFRLLAALRLATRLMRALASQVHLFLAVGMRHD
jgi:hypothetical protein